jgi:ribosome-associated protein
MIYISDTITLDENDIQMDFIRASGPGGQNVNKVSSAVQLRFDAAGCAALNDSIRQRLKKIAGKRLTAEGILIIKAQRHRSQDQNRQDAVDRLVAMIRQAAQAPKYRRPTKPTSASKKRRLTAKRQRGELKRHRRAVRQTGDENCR